MPTSSPSCTASPISNAEDPAPSTQKYPILLKGHGGTVICNVKEAAPGEVVTFTAIPEKGKVFTDFKIFDPNKEIDLTGFRVLETENEYEYYFIMVAHEMIVDCFFK